MQRATKLYTVSWAETVLYGVDIEAESAEEAEAKWHSGNYDYSKIEEWDSLGVAEADLKVEEARVK